MFKRKPKRQLTQQEIRKKIKTEKLIWAIVGIIGVISLILFFIAKYTGYIPS